MPTAPQLFDAGDAVGPGVIVGTGNLLEDATAVADGIGISEGPGDGLAWPVPEATRPQADMSSAPRSATATAARDPVLTTVPTESCISELSNEPAIRCPDRIPALGFPRMGRACPAGSSASGNRYGLPDNSYVLVRVTETTAHQIGQNSVQLIRGQSRAFHRGSDAPDGAPRRR